MIRRGARATRVGSGWAGARAKGTAARAGRHGHRTVTRPCETISPSSPPALEDHAPCSNDSSAPRSRTPPIAARIPPGQYKTDKFPVLHYGSVPHTDLATWDFKVWGEVDSPVHPDLGRSSRRCRARRSTTDIHCVTRWTKLDTTWEGVPIQTILEMAGVRPSATHVVSHAEQGYTANVPLSVLDDDDVLLADTFGGEPLELEHGYPLRLLIPKRYFWKSSKWVRGLEFLDHDQLGFWERYGYNNDADPWKEERFSE